MKELYVTALLKSLDEASDWAKVLEIDIASYFKENQTLIEEIQTAILPKGKSVRGHTQQILSPFSFKEGAKDFSVASSKLIQVVVEDNQLKKRAKPKLLPTYYPTFKTSDGTAFADLLEEFKQDLKKVKREEQILALMRQYFSLVSADDTGVSLYDYARLTAAIACCGAVNKKENCPSDELLFIKGDVSGIQDFIFNITSKRAAKSLKTRSFRVQVLAKLAIQYILKKFALPKANLLYDGGGNFYIFAPASKESEIDDLKKYFAKRLLDDDLHVHLGHVKIQTSDLNNFGEKWKAVAQSMGKDKLQLFKPLKRKKIFKPLPIENLTEEREKEAKDYAKISSMLNIAKGFEILPDAKKGNVYSKFGYSFELQKRKELGKNSVVFNSFNNNQSDFTFAVTEMPVWTEQLIEIHEKELKEAIKEDKERVAAINKRKKPFEPREKGDFAKVEVPSDLKGKIIEFHWLAHFAHCRTGTKKLGVVKMDIDGLGNMFKDGLKKHQNTVLHVAALSRVLKWFFEGYMNTLLDQAIDGTMDSDSETFRDNIYVLFSGGDDFFLVGAWDIVLEFASIVRQEFLKLNHQTLTISAGYVLTDPKFPVTRFATLADDAESDAKTYNQKYVEDKNSDEAKVKDKMAIFGQVISWTDMAEAEKLRDQLCRLVQEKGEPRSVINKIQKSMYGYTNIHQKMLRGKGITIPRLWRLNQFLRTIKKSNQEEAQSIIDLYEETFENALKKESKAANPAFIAVAARWAEFLTRKK